MKYKLFKIKSKQYPQFMHEVDEDNPLFVGELKFPLTPGRRAELADEVFTFVSSPVVNVKENDNGYFVETVYSYYELRRMPSSTSS